MTTQSALPPATFPSTTTVPSARSEFETALPGAGVDAAAARRTARIGTLSAVLCSAGFTYLSFDSLLDPVPRDHRDIAFLWPWVTGAIALYQLHRVQAHAVGRLGRLSTCATLGGMALAALGMLPRLADADPVMPVLGLGMVLWIIGMCGFGAATIRARVVPAFAGIALILAQPVTVALGQMFTPIAPLSDFGSYSGALGNAVAWLLLACALSTIPGRGSGASRTAA